ncbi:prepilin-type N-terminal cleavage/methylation domain-containing protein [Streptomyces sp. NPDC048331]|uniref:prepilin-type N-terminal cleavage/methylation domain-containing protein n=1 Tax=Streptomyces sp. NPDC048331 TaxID=3365534 RepID=UPI0037145995
MTPDHRPFRLRAGRQDGFTLIELLVVIVILGVLSAIVVFSVKGIGDKGRASAVAADAATLRAAEEAHCAKHGRYATIDELKDAGLLTGEPVYNMVAVGEENKCGRGANSSYTLYDNAPTQSTKDAISVGASPNDLAVDEKADRVYVASAGDNSVTVIDGRTDEPIGSPISLSGVVSGPTRIAVDSGTGRVYVGGTDGVAIIDTANAYQVTKVGNYATPVSGLAVSPENGDLYIGGGTTFVAAIAYVPAGGSAATTIPVPSGGPVPAAAGMDFVFDPARHAVYFAKGGTGSGTSPDIGLFAISTQTHEARTVVEFPTKSSCVNNIGALSLNSARGMIVLDPHRNLVYLIARRCTANPTKGVATMIAINPGNGTSTAIDDPEGTPYGHMAAVYSPAASSVYVYSTGGTPTASCGTLTAGRVSRIVGTAVTGQTAVCGISSSPGNAAHRATVLKNFNRVFISQFYQVDASGKAIAPGGIGVTDGTTMLPQSTLGAPRPFSSMAVNNTTGKLYALDPVGGKLAVFRAGAK